MSRRGPGGHRSGRSRPTGDPMADRAEDDGPGPLAMIPVLAGLVLGALLGTWVSATIAVHLGGYYSGEVLRTGQAEITGCRTGLWLTATCRATVTWSDGSIEQDVEVGSISTPPPTVPVAEHEHLTYLWSAVLSDPVTLVRGFPAGRHTGLATAAIYLTMAVVGLTGGGAAALVQGRALRRRRQRA